MNKALAFWIASSIVLFLLSLVFFHHNLQRKNLPMAAWLVTGVLSELLAAWGLAAGYHPWMATAGRASEWLGVLMTVTVVSVAATRWGCPVNRALALALGGMLAANMVSEALSYNASLHLEAWLRNISFFGPALYLLVTFSGLRMDRLPLLVSKVGIFGPRLIAILGHARSVLG